MTERTPIPKRVRFAVMTRDDFTCHYCRATRDDGVKLTIDHVVPVVLGGTADPSNLVTCCADCNSGKSSMSPDDHTVAQVAADAARWAAAMKQAAQEIRTRRDAATVAVAAWEHRWRGWTRTINGVTEQAEALPRGWEQSVRALLEAGADVDALIGYVDRAMTSKANDVFKYFCGCGWAHVREIQSRATELASAQPIDPPPAPQPDLTSNDAYWAGHVAGYDDGHQDGWEMGLAIATVNTAREPVNAEPVPLAVLLQPPKDV